MVASGIIQFLLVLICLVFFGGIGLLIGGLIAKKKVLWIWGIIVMFVFFILFALGGLAYKSFNRNYPEVYSEPYAAEATEVTSQEYVDSLGVVPAAVTTDLQKTFGAPFYGICINDYDQQYRMPLYIDPQLKDLGINALSFETKRDDGSIMNTKLSFTSVKPFNRKCMFIVHGSGTTKRLEHVATIKISIGAETIITITIPEADDLSGWRYCTLTLFE